MKIIFLGLLFCEESLGDAFKYSKCGVQMAPHLFCSRLIGGLAENDGVSVHTLGVSPVGSFPMNYKKLFVGGYRLPGHTQVGYLDLPIVKHKIQAKKLYREILREAGNEEAYVIAYSLYEPFLDAIIRAKKKLPNLHITVLQPDAIPGRNGMIYSEKMKKLGDRLVQKAKCADDFIFLSRHVSEVIDLQDRPFCVVDCICDSNQTESTKKETSENIFLYTGATAREYGICNVVDAFANIPEAKLWICGMGNADGYIQSVAEKRPNIKHFGYVSQQEVARLRDECDFLLNPRVPTGTFTRYSFPSKTAEYMMSGKPVVMYRLEGLGEEYDELLNYLSAPAGEELENELRQIMNIPYEVLQNRADRAREFMINNKNATVQGRMVIDMLKRRER